MFKRIIPTTATAVAGLLIGGQIAVAQFAPQGPMPASSGYPTTARQQQTQPDASGIPTTVHQVEGNMFRYAIPAGWQAQESPQGVGVFSPDHTYGYGVVMLQGVPASSPEELVKIIFQGMGVRDLQFNGGQPQNANGMQGLMSFVSFTGTDGQARRGLVNACLGRTPQGNAGMICFAASVKQQWDCQGVTLVSLASRIMPKGMNGGAGGMVPSGPAVPQTPGYGPTPSYPPTPSCPPAPTYTPTPPPTPDSGPGTGRIPNHGGSGGYQPVNPRSPTGYRPEDPLWD